MKLLRYSLSTLLCFGTVQSATSSVDLSSRPALKEASPAEVLSVLSTERLPASSKLGRSLLSGARQLGYNNNYNANKNKSYDSSWMANYDIVFHHCFNEYEDFSNVKQGDTITYVTFNVCASKYSCNPNTCARKGAEYVVTLQNFLKYYMDLMDETCENSKDSCDYYCANNHNTTLYGYGNYYDYDSCQMQCLEDAEMDHCIASTTSFAQGRRVRDRVLSGSGSGDGNGENGEGGSNDHQSGSGSGDNKDGSGDDEEVVVLNDFGTMKEYSNCAKVVFNETNYQNYYMGPVCSESGRSIYFGLYTDNKCAAGSEAAEGTFEVNSYGYSMPFSVESGSAVATSRKQRAMSQCLSCSDGQDAYYKDQTHVDCSTLRTSAVATCESTLTNQLEENGIEPVVTGCDTVEEFNHVARYGVTPKPLTVWQLIMRGMVFAGVFLAPAVGLKAYARYSYSQNGEHSGDSGNNGSSKYVLDGASDLDGSRESSHESSYTEGSQSQDGVMA